MVRLIIFLLGIVVFVFPDVVFADEDVFYSSTIYYPKNWEQQNNNGDSSLFLIDDWKVIPGFDWESLISQSSSLPEFVNFKVSYFFLLDPVNSSQADSRDFVWNYVDDGNYYLLHFSDFEIQVARFINGEIFFNAKKGAEFKQGENLVKIKVVGGEIDVWLNDIPTISVVEWREDFIPVGYPINDPNISTRLGFLLKEGITWPTEAKFYDLILRPTGEFILPVPFYGQADDRWGKLEYNHAKNWSRNPTIERWGCALVSATMVFNYHGLNNLPSGEVLTPKSLNQWLVNEKDGYMGNGYLNWLALTRLSRKINQTFAEKNLPKFEFIRFGLSGSGGNYDNYAVNKLNNFLNNGVPVIGQVPGHFLVMTGFKNSEKTIWQINDPLFEVNKISFNSRYSHPNGQIQSVRVLVPSQTDQSYWLFEHSPAVKIKIIDELGREVIVETEKVELWDDFLLGGGNEFKPLTTSWVEKPLVGRYFLEVIGNSTEEIKFWSYNQEAEVVSKIFDKENSKYSFDFNKEVGLIGLESAAVEKVLKTSEELFSWEKFIERLSQALELGKIDEILYARLKKLATHALKNPDDRYRHLLEKLLSYNTLHETRSWLLGQIS